MRITRLELTNFRSFSHTQAIEFAPVTLLFGANSVGKSSVLMALHYLQQILAKGQCNPLRLESLGNKYVGGFKSLVHRRQTDSSIGIKVRFEKSDSVGASYARIAELVGHDLGLAVDSATAAADSMEFGVGVSWSDGDAYVSQYKLYLDDEVVADMRCDSRGAQPYIAYLNYQHPLLQDDGEFSEEEGFVSRFHQQMNAGRFKDKAPESEGFIHVPLNFRGLNGAIPVPEQLLETPLDVDDKLENARIQEILSDALVAPLDNALRYLQESVCIGPIRTIPDPTYQKNPYPEQSDWYNGQAAWDLLGRSSTQLMNMNIWLGEGHLNLGYQLRQRINYSKSAYMGSENILVDMAMQGWASDGRIRIDLSEEDPSEVPDTPHGPSFETPYQVVTENEAALIKQGVIHQRTENKVVLWDAKNNIEVSATDIGVGVSQVFPLILAAVEPKISLVSCEQPELHLHPRVQVELADLMIENSKDRTFLIETHSEHLVLRLLRRIREGGVSLENVSVVYVGANENGVVVERQQITEDGDFEHNWPDGFFDERDEELF